jgi:hypothetical protein
VSPRCSRTRAAIVLPIRYQSWFRALAVSARVSVWGEMASAMSAHRAATNAPDQMLHHSCSWTASIYPGVYGARFYPVANDGCWRAIVLDLCHGITPLMSLARYSPLTGRMNRQECDQLLRSAWSGD